MEMIDQIKAGRLALLYLESVYEGAIRIIGLVQRNSAFFGDPKAGSQFLTAAADKLESLIALHREPTDRDKCPGCGKKWFIRILGNGEVICDFCGIRKF
jgi:hypothetical protein